MTVTEIPRRDIRTLKEFYTLMADTRELRSKITSNVIKSKPVDSNAVASLENAWESLKAIPGDTSVKPLALDGEKRIRADLSYEIIELRKDIDFLTLGEERFLESLDRLHDNFLPQVQAGVKKLQGLRFQAFITDRDGTTNNYCGRYNSSIQSVWNAVFLTRFAGAKTRFPIMLTSAPLTGPGITGVSVNPKRSFIYAASKGREFIDLNGERKHYPIETDKQALLDKLHLNIAVLLEKEGYEKFGLIGSGLQFKFGQITVARQDISGSIESADSLAFLDTIKAMTLEMDPKGANFRIEDTGLDIEIILTIGDATTGLKDFDKGDGVKYLDKALGMNMSQGPHLICGDTGSDLPMIAASLEKCLDTWSIFVTQKEDIASRVRTLCPNSVIVPEPDCLVVMLRFLAEQS